MIRCTVITRVIRWYVITTVICYHTCDTALSHHPCVTRCYPITHVIRGVPCHHPCNTVRHVDALCGTVCYLTTRVMRQCCLITRLMHHSNCSARPYSSSIYIRMTTSTPRTGRQHAGLFSYLPTIHTYRYGEAHRLMFGASRMQG